MAYDAELADRIRAALSDHEDITERQMFGGLCFMLAGHMCCGIVDDELMARVGPEQYASALEHPHSREMDFTGRSMQGFVYVAPSGLRSDRALQDWIESCVRFVTTLPPKPSRS
jgi:TfoX/Sxy family transcriptional regulator of competence genes